MQQSTHFLEFTWNFLKDRQYIWHKTSLNKFNKTEIISNIISYENGMKLEINYKKETRKIINMWILSMILNKLWINENKIKVEIGNYLKTNKNMIYQNWWNIEKVVLRGKFYSNAGLLQEVRKISNKQSNPTPKGTRKRRTMKPQVRRRK